MIKNETSMFITCPREAGADDEHSTTTLTQISSVILYKKKGEIQHAASVCVRWWLDLSSIVSCHLITVDVVHCSVSTFRTVFMCLFSHTNRARILYNIIATPIPNAVCLYRIDIVRFTDCCWFISYWVRQQTSHQITFIRKRRFI